MPKPYSNDLRDRLVCAVEDGLSASAAAEQFGVSASSGIRWVRRMRATGSAAFKPTGGNRRAKLTEQADWLLHLIREQPDLSLADIQQRLRAEKAVIAGYGSIWRFFAVRKISFKKTSSDRRSAYGGRNGPRYPEPEGSGRRVFVGFDPVKNRGPWAVEDLRVVTLSSDPD